MSESLEEILARMSEKKWPRILFGAMATLTTSAIPAVAAAVAIDPRAGFLVAAIYGAMGQSPDKIDLSSPLAFAALVQREFTD